MKTAKSKIDPVGFIAAFFSRAMSYSRNSLDHA